ncbi:MAG: hypothetical protein LBU77_00155 [Clostridiales bacterium]|jgi:hypothetical protein|nr:hypothetical protein [Clostridiales bacterium]
MATELKRMTFAVTPEMEPVIDRAKKMFYDRTQSEMIRVLVVEGLNFLEMKQLNQNHLSPNVQPARAI